MRNSWGEFGKFQIISSGGCAFFETAFHQRFDALRNSFFWNAVIAKAFQWVRPMLDPVTMEKVELHAGVPTERFLELMPAAVLPACYGGANAATSYPETGRA